MFYHWVFWQTMFLDLFDYSDLKWEHLDEYTIFYEYNREPER